LLSVKRSWGKNSFGLVDLDLSRAWGLRFAWTPSNSVGRSYIILSPPIRSDIQCGSER
jgi:hypothetical protein